MKLIKIALDEYKVEMKRILSISFQGKELDRINNEIDNAKTLEELRDASEIAFSAECNNCKKCNDVLVRMVESEKGCILICPDCIKMSFGLISGMNRGEN